MHEQLCTFFMATVLKKPDTYSHHKDLIGLADVNLSWNAWWTQVHKKTTVV